MSYKQVFGLALLILLLSGRSAFADPLERDIVGIESAETQIDTASLPGLVSGESIMYALQDALELVRSGIPRAAAPGLNRLDRELRQLLAGASPDSPLPGRYRRGDELWLPIKAQALRVWLDAPDLLMRRTPRQAQDHDNNLPALAQRTRWLPLRRTAGLIESSLPLVAIGERSRSLRLLREAVRGVRSRMAFEQAQQIHAYYALEAALAKLPHWNEGLRSRLRHAAEQLSGDNKFSDLGTRLRAQADSITPDFRELQGLALDLRRRLISVGGKPQKKTQEQPKSDNQIAVKPPGMG